MARLDRYSVICITLVVACGDGGAGRPPDIVLDTGDPESDTGTVEDMGPWDEADMPPGDVGGDGDGDGDGDDQPYGPPLYPGDRVHSPINAFVRDNLASIRNLAATAPDDVFMKVGASSTVNPSTLYCFADGVVDLDVYEAPLGPALDFFLLGQAAGTTPFDRDTLAAQVGQSAGWAISGAPCPVDQERAAINPEGPSLALVHYGTNDMQQGITYASALPGYFANMSDLLDLLIDSGVIPVVFGISRRLDTPAADLWVQSYNAVARGLAQARSIPFIDLRFALEPLPGYGLSGDGLHLESFPDGPCIFSPEGLTHGYNVRNLIALELLSRVHRSLVLGEQLADAAPQLSGQGDLDDPLIIPMLPFADTNTTVDGPSMMLDEYTGCGAMADESGPELIYEIELTASTPIRAMVLDRAGVDIDIHLLDDSGTVEGCLARDDFMIERTLEPGTYYFALDTYVDGQSGEQSGEYTFVVLACEAQDVDCML